MNPYEVLQIAPGACSPANVERAYKRAARLAHPDRDGGSIERMTEVNQARDILVNPERRKRFDELGSTDTGQLSIEEQAMLILGNILMAVLEQAPEGVSQAKIMGAISVEIEKGRQKALEARRTHPRRIARVKSILKSIKCDDFLRRAFEARLASLERQVMEINMQIELGNFMIKMMRTVEFQR
jgi:curved DNA-binding protein CbpA